MGSDMGGAGRCGTGDRDSQPLRRDFDDRVLGIVLISYIRLSAGVSVVSGMEDDFQLTGMTVLGVLGFEVHPASGRLTSADMLL